MKPRIRRAAATSVCAAATVIALTSHSPASASISLGLWTSDLPKSGASASYDTPTFTVCDDKADGMRAVGWISRYSNGAWTTVELQDADGANSTCAHTTFSIASGQQGKIKICKRDGANGANEYCRSDGFFG